MTGERPAHRLAVAVPTFNRADCLRRLLTDLAEQIRADGLTDVVGICVSDNASTDRTPELIAEFRRTHPDIALIAARNETNVGFMGNIRRVVERADSEFVALTGDDDLILPGSLRRILAACEFPSDVILFNSWPGTGRWVRSLSPDDGARRMVSSGVEANEALGVFHASFLGNCVFRRRAFVEAYLPAYESSRYPHTYVAMHLLGFGPALFINYATFAVNDERREWSALQPWLTAVDMAKLQTDMVLSRGASRREIAAVYRELTRSVPRAVLQARKSVGALPVSPRELWHCYRCSRFYQALALAYWAGARALPRMLVERLIRSFSSVNAT